MECVIIYYIATNGIRICENVELNYYSIIELLPKYQCKFRSKYSIGCILVGSKQNIDVKSPKSHKEDINLDFV